MFDEVLNDICMVIVGALIGFIAFLFVTKTVVIKTYNNAFEAHLNEGYMVMSDYEVRTGDVLGRQVYVYFKK